MGTERDFYLQPHGKIDPGLSEVSSLDQVTDPICPASNSLKDFQGASDCCLTRSVHTDK